MKHILFSILIFACLNHLAGQTITENIALKVAACYLNAQTGKTTTAMTIVPGPTLRGGNPAYFICTPGNRKGFVIVAGTKASTPILAYSPDNTFSTENMPPPVQYWINGYKTQLEEIVEKDLRPTPQMTSEWSSLEKGTYDSPETIPVGPLLQTMWNQNPIYNKYCPSTGGVQAPTGCDATAMAQVMKYWNYPISGSTNLTDTDNDSSDGISGTFTATVGGQYYQWQNMPNSLLPNTNQNQINQVAKLMYDCGVAAKMDYGMTVSSANPDDARKALINTFGYNPSSSLEQRNNYSTNNWLLKIESELNSGNPVIYSGYDPVAGGHTWVCDGYNSSGLFSMNWGWGGSSNGFYALNALNPSPTNAGDHFNSTQNAIVGIMPLGCQAFYEGPLPFFQGVIQNTFSTSEFTHITSGTLSSGIKLSMHAGIEVVLKPGFTALSGSTAHIFIQGCTGSFDAPSDDRSEPEAPTTIPPAIGLTVFPNPTADYITLQFTLPADGDASLKLLDLTGKTTLTIFENQQFPAGDQQVKCALDKLPAGVYFAKLETAGNSSMRKIMKVN